MLSFSFCAKITELSKRYPTTRKAYRIVAALDDFYASHTIAEGKGKILAYFQNRLTNAICEGINSMIQAAKLLLDVVSPF